jgi:hypothetical protein
MIYFKSKFIFIYLANALSSSLNLGSESDIKQAEFKHNNVLVNMLMNIVRTTTRGSNGSQNVTQLTNDHPSRVKMMLQ